MGIRPEIEAYFESLRRFDASADTEHTLRPALQALLEAFTAGRTPAVLVRHEPRRDPEGRGAPDFQIHSAGVILGYVETKKPGEDLAKVVKSEQIRKYAALSPNILVTDYVHWVWLRDGKAVEEASLGAGEDVGNRRARLDPGRAEAVAALLAKFTSFVPGKIGRSRDLAQVLAVRCHFLKDYLAESLRERKEGRLYGLYEVFQREILHELTPEGFADAFAQTLGYGLFLARLNAPAGTKLDLTSAKVFVPGNFELIRELVSFLDELDRPEYHRLRWVTAEILNILNALDLVAIHDDLSFLPRQRKLLELSEEERLFERDPYVYFYEDFLKNYDARMRKSRGVYYTPPPAVHFIVRCIGDILVSEFGLSKGLADHRKVTLLDFATGTGTFLIEVLRQIFESTPKNLRMEVIREHILKNIYGFEYLIAPYTIAHLKLSQFLRGMGYEFTSEDRLQIFLTNTLEQAEPQQNWLLPAVTREVFAAQDVKSKPILVITGNPPYSGHSKNKGAWIAEQIEAYKKIDGAPLGERNLKWLQDDYVKFIRFAQWKMERVEEGVVGIITNHSFLDNPTFRGMRRSLLCTFNQIYVFDLHGNAKKSERPPKGGKDENIFDIEQGVAISLFVKRRGLEAKVCHADLWGTRKEKYQALAGAARGAVKWAKVTPAAPDWLFKPRGKRHRRAYGKGWMLTDIFPVHSVGITTSRDHLSIGFDRRELLERLKSFASLPIEMARSRHALGDDVLEWSVAAAQKDLEDHKFHAKHIVPILYRPFDARVTFFTGRSKGLHCRPRAEVMRHFLAGPNLGLVVCRGQEITGPWHHVFCTDMMIQLHTASNKEGNYVLPLYVYEFEGSRKKSANGELFAQGGARHENIAPEFREFIVALYGKRYAPEAIAGYIYAVLHSPAFRQRYAEFLRADFPRVPLVPDRKLFEQLAASGNALMAAHLLKNVPGKRETEISRGPREVEKITYREATGQVYINPHTYFAPVPRAVWEFRIGGYPVVEKYLKSRRGRSLGLGEIETACDMVRALAFTGEAMAAIDQTGWLDTLGALDGGP